jgi:hypothetical protein
MQHLDLPIGLEAGIASTIAINRSIEMSGSAAS